MPPKGIPVGSTIDLSDVVVKSQQAARPAGDEEAEE